MVVKEAHAKASEQKETPKHGAQTVFKRSPLSVGPPLPHRENNPEITLLVGASLLPIRAIRQISQSRLAIQFTGQMLGDCLTASGKFAKK